MTNQTNTSGGANVDGNVNTKGGDFVGRDQITINKIVIVGRFLELAQVEGLLPKIEDNKEFQSIVDAIEGTFKSQPNENLLKAVEYAGKILGDVLIKLEKEDSSEGISRGHLIEAFIQCIGETLSVNHQWSDYSKTIKEVTYLPLKSTSMIYEKYFNVKKEFGIEERLHIAKANTFEFITLKDTGFWSSVLGIKQYNNKERQILLMGIVLDLITIGSDNADTVQFLKGLSDLFKLS